MTKDPRILLVSDAFKFAGTERHIADLARALNSLGVDVSVACPQDSILWKESAALGISVYNWDAANPIVDLLTVQGLLSENRIDIVHTHNGISNLLVTFAAQLVGRGKCINTYHFIEPTRAKRTGVMRSVVNALHKHASAQVSNFIAVSNAVAAGCHGYANGKPVDVIPNGIFPKQSTTTRRAKRQELGISDDATLIVSAARLAPEKDLGDLINAVSLAKDSVPNIRCLVAGEGPEKKALSDLIAKLQVGQFVQLLGFRHDVPDLIQAADIFVLPSANEPFGLAILEAMVLEKPVLVADSGGPLEIVEPGETGFFFKANDPGSLAEQLKAVAANKDQLSSMGLKAARVVREKFDAVSMAKATLAVYRRVAAN